MPARVRSGLVKLAVGSTLCALALLAGTPSRASTVTAQDGTGNFGTVTVTQGTNELDFSINVAPNILVSTGFPASFAFTTDTAVNFGPISSNASVTWSSVGDGTGTGLHMDGAGFFGGGVTFPNTGPGPHQGGTQLSFSITAPGLKLADLIGNASWMFALDLLKSDCSSNCTGVFVVGKSSLGGGNEGGSAPLPGAIAMFAPVLGSGYLFSRWRRRRSRKSAAAC